jgi:hypothetical protein
MAQFGSIISKDWMEMKTRAGFIVLLLSLFLLAIFSLFGQAAAEQTMETARPNTLIMGQEEADAAWVKRLNTRFNKDDVPKAMTVDKVGNVYVTGASGGATYQDVDYLTVKYAANGKQEWASRYDGSFLDYDCPSSISVDSRGNVYVSGISRGRNDNDYDYVTIKHSSEGKTVWVRRYVRTAIGKKIKTSYPPLITSDDNGSAVLAGATWGFSGNDFLDFLLVKYDEHGNLLWERMFHTAPERWDYATAVTTDGAGNIYVAGSSREYQDAGGFAALGVVVKYGKDGSFFWSSAFDVGIPRSLKVDTGGKVSVCGTNGTVRLDTNGVEVWRQSIASTGYMDLDPVGNTLVVGVVKNDLTGFDFAITKFDQEGKTQWTRQYDSPFSRDDIPSGIVVASNGRIFVTGGSMNSYSLLNYDFVTVAYDDNGTELSAERYNGKGHGFDFPAAIAVDGLGRVTVTGASEGTATALDFATVNYQDQSQLSIIPRKGLH